MVKISRQVTVGTAFTQLFFYDKTRTSWGISNQGTGAIFIDGDKSVTLVDGFPIEARTGTLFANVGLGDDPTLAVFAISTANRDVRLFEQRRPKKDEVKEEL